MNRFLIASAAALALTGCARAESDAAFGERVRAYLLENPEVIQEAVERLQVKQQAGAEASAKAAIEKNRQALERDPRDFVANPNGRITVVEFFDYNCGYCKRGLPEVQKLIETDKKVRFVFVELPILSKGSVETAKIALAAKRQGKYWEFHQAMLTAKGQANEASALKVAEGLGLDMAKLKADYAGDAVKAELESMSALAKKMQINGTPHFLVGDKSIPGAPEDLHNQLEGLVADFRKSGCGYC